MMSSANLCSFLLRKMPFIETSRAVTGVMVNTEITNTHSTIPPESRSTLHVYLLVNHPSSTRTGKGTGVDF